MAIARGIPLTEESGIGALTLGSYLLEVSALYHDAEAAVICLDGHRESWTYRKLSDRSFEVAQALRACGVGHGTRVGLLVSNRLEFLSCLFGCALAGAVASPFSTFWTEPELDAAIRQSRCSLLLFEGAILKKDFVAMLCSLEPEILQSAPGQLSSPSYPYLSHLARVDSQAGTGAIEGWSDFLHRGHGTSRAVVEACSRAISPSDAALLFFSSGSTGKAKGIISSHRAVSLQLWRWRNWYAIDVPPRTWSANGFFFSGNFAMALGGTLSSGGCLLLQRSFDAAAALALIEVERASMLLAWPHQWAQFEATPTYATTDLSRLRYIDANGPLAAHHSVKTSWREPAQAYGATETFTLISVFASGTPESITAGSHGRPTAGSTLKIINPETKKIAQVGECGEIAVKGPTLMLGYIDILAEHIFDDEGFYHTGDSGYLDETGRLFWRGRLNDIVKTGGANISPLEVDAVIYHHPAVKLCQTVGIPDPLLGEIVVTCLVAWPGTNLTECEVRDHARKSLASYKVPRHVLFFEEEDLKTTGSAKIKTSELRMLAANRLRLRSKVQPL